MGTFVFCEILGNILRRSRFRLVHEVYQSSRRSFFCKIYKNNFKNQVLGVKLPLVPLWYHDVVFCTCQSNNAITMPKHKEDSSDSKHAAEKKLSKKLHLKSGSLKSIKKKKKKKAKKTSHHHKKSKSKERSSKLKTLVSQKTEVVLLGSSPENNSNDSDICIIYDSHKRSRKFEPNLNVRVKKNTYEPFIKEKAVKICGENEQNDVSKETNECFILHEVSEQCAPVRQTCENVLISEEEQNLISTHTSGDGFSSVLKSDQVSGPSSGRRVDKYTRKNNIKRKWELTDFGQTMSDEDKGSLPNERSYLIFNVLSYNVLCQEIMEEHMDLYHHHDPNYLQWEFRSKLLMKEFMDFSADVMCLQEVQESHLASFYSELQKIGYTGLFKRRTGGKKDGVAIYFRNSTFQLIDYTTVEYCQPGVSVLNRDNVGLIVKLAPKMKPDERIIVATTHLLYNPRRHDVKLAQVQLLLAEVERYAFKGIDESTKTTNYWPVILTGDMNFEPNSGGFKLLDTGWFRFDGLCSRTLTEYGTGTFLGKTLIPPDLGVTDYCQHMSLVAQRDLRFTPDYEVKSKDDHKTEIKMLKIYNSDFSKYISSSGSIEITERELNQEKFSSGQLHHALQLSSVYTHDPEEYFNRCQVSTFQDGWVVVDYIFYSNPDLSSKQEGNLKLVARYKLLSAKEAAEVGPIPNGNSPSDHYPLAAKFALLF